MAKVVEIMGVTHNPLYCPRMQNPKERNPGVLRVKEGFGEMRQTLAAARPDVLVCIGNDHLNQWFMDNMPAFLVGKAPWCEGPWTWEKAMGVPSYRAKVQVDLAKALLRGGYEHGVDFAFSDEFKFDHAFSMPLALVRPESDIPIVPIFTNVMAPPIPPAKRFHQVGEAIREVIEGEWPQDLRVGVLCSGHLSVEIGGPRGFGPAPDLEFDDLGVQMVGKGDVSGLLREMTMERFMKAGNYTAGFLNFIMLLGIARGEPASHAECVHSDTNSAPFLTWDLYK